MALEVVDERTCELTIEPVESKDDGIWNLTIEAGSGKNKKLVLPLSNEQH